MAKLLIVESPAKSKTISKYVGDDYIVKASVGHIRDLPKSNKKAIDIASGFVPTYEISKGKEEVVSELRKLAQKSSEVILATDPDREGEAIAWHVKEACGLKNPKRIVFYEITKEAVNEAIKNPREIDGSLVKAQEARRVLDRLVGYDLSGLIWKKVRYGLSAGRVQSPALRIIMEREREIRAFKPERFFVITARLKNSKGEFDFLCSEEPKEETEAERIIREGKGGNWSVTDVKETEQKRSPRPPFITSTLQQTASSRLGFSPSRTMGVAQKLYEAGLITYMRTDSVSIGKDAQGQILSLVEKKYGKEYASRNFYKSKSKNAQEAHEAIRPTNVNLERAGQTPEQEKLYELIRQRAVASQMSDAKMLKTKISANINGGSIPEFGLNGSVVLFPGWIAADPLSAGEDVSLPKFSVGDKLSLVNIGSLAKETEPPGRYTEAGLIKELEKRDIGRPSTYAAIIKTILERDYVVKENKSLRPTDTGEVVSGFLEENFPKYVSDTFTAEMEQELDEIADGKRDYVKTLKDFYGPFSKDIKSKEKLEKATNLGEADENIRCPKCGGKMIIKLGRTGKFLSCAKFPECDGARTIDGKELEGPKETGEECPKCGGKLVERDGRFGRFVACSNYPKCKFIKKSAEEEARAKTGIKCPKCNEGEMSERRGRFGIFYSCSNYPECKYAIKAKPTGRICDLCGALMMEGTKTIPERCSSKACSNHNPHKKTA